MKNITVNQSKFHVNKFVDSVKVVSKEVKYGLSVVWEPQVITEDGEDVIEEQLKKFEELVRVINKETNKVMHSG